MREHTEKHIHRKPLSNAVCAILSIVPSIVPVSTVALSSSCLPNQLRNTQRENQSTQRENRE